MKKNFRPVLVWLWAWLLAAGVWAAEDAGAGRTDILFIGNSLTYYNNLEKMFEGLARLRGHNVACTAATNGGKNLVFQSTAKNVVEAVKKGGYEIVVLQDIVGRFNAEKLMAGAEAVLKLVRQYNPDAKIVFYAPWPDKNNLNPEKLAYFIDNYQAAARKFGGVLAPAGEAFYDLYTNHKLDFYADDRHPKPLGSFISATAVYHAIYPEEKCKPLTQADLEGINGVINRAVPNKESYPLETLNLIEEKANHYTQARRQEEKKND